MIKICSFFIINFLCLSGVVFGAVGNNFKGKVLNPKGEPYPFVTIQLVSMKKQTATGKNGEFSFNDVTPGSHRIYCFGAGSRPKDTTIYINENNENYFILNLSDSYIITDNVVVTGTRTVKEVENNPIATEVITNDDIKSKGSLRLSELLEDETGLNMVEGNGKGIQIQGLDPQYAMVLINGEPVIGRNAGILDLDRLSVGNIKRIEVVKGPSSSLYGSYALAGVINLITETPDVPFKWNVSSRYASHNTLDLSAGVSANSEDDKYGITLFANRLTSDGYSEGNDLLGNLIPEFTNYTFNTDLFCNLSADIQFKLGGRINTESQYNFYEANDKSGLKAIVDDSSNLIDGDIHLTYKHQVNEDLNIETRLYATKYSTDIQNRYRESGEIYDSYTFDQTMLKAEIQSNFMANKFNVVTFGGGVQFEEANAARIAGIKKINLYYAYLQEDWLISDKANVIGSLRYDYQTNFTDKLSPKLAGSYELYENLILRASIGTGFKVPTFQQQYMDWSNPLVGYDVFGTSYFNQAIEKLKADGVIDSFLIDPSSVGELIPEKSWSVNAGFSYSFNDWFDVKVNAFRNNLSDMIDIQPIAQKSNGQQVWTYFNLNRVFTQGIESDFHFKFLDYFDLNIGYQYLETADEDVLDKIENEEIWKLNIYGVQRPVWKSEYGGLMNRSKHTLNVKLKYEIEEYGFKAFLRNKYRSKFGYQDLNGNKILDNDNEYLMDYSLWYITFTLDIYKNFTLQIGIDNIFDYRPARFISANPGRIIFIGLKYNYGT